MSFIAQLFVENQVFDLLVAEYEIRKQVDYDNKPISRAMSAPISLVVKSDERSFLSDWAASLADYKSGKIVFYRWDTGSKMKELHFVDAKCVQCREVFNADNDEPMEMHVQITARQLTMGSSTVDNRWPISGGLSAADRESLSKKSQDSSDSQAAATTKPEPTPTPAPKPAASPLHEKIEAMPAISPETLNNKQIGDRAEEAAEEYLKAQGYTEFIKLQNKSGHGVDIIAKKPNGDVVCVEVKGNGAKLNEGQEEGGEKYVDKKIQEALDSEDVDYRKKGKQAQKWIKKSGNTEYKILRAEVDINNGKVKKISEQAWTAAIDGKHREKAKEVFKAKLS